MSRERELIGLLRSEFPLLDDDGLDENEHHCEWAIQQDRKRLHALLADLSLQAEPAPAQDEREAFEARMRLGGYSNPEKHPDGSYVSSAMELWWQGWKARATRPSQTALSAVTAERDRLREELAATNQGINAKLPGRKFAAVGTGALYAEQNYCYRRGWKEGVAALRAQIRAATMTAKEA